MNRRSFLRLVAAAIAAPYLPDIAIPARVMSHIDPTLLFGEAVAREYHKRMDEIIIRALC